MSSYSNSEETKFVESHLQDGLVRSTCPLCGSAKSEFERTVAGFILEKCTQCTMVYMNPRCTAAQLRSIYSVRNEDAMVDLYSEIATKDVLESYSSKLEQIEKNRPSKGRLLDYACAAGYFFEIAQKRGWDAYGYDIGDWVLKAAKIRNLRNMIAGVDLETAFEKESFDVIYAAQVFEHLLDPVDSLYSLLKLLKPGGLLYIDVPNYHTLPIMLDKDDFMLNEPPQHINYYTPKTLEHLLRLCDMKNINMYSEGGLKYENLFGRPITSEIAEAYGLVEGESDSQNKHRMLGQAKTHLKEGLKNIVINPLFYSGMKVGMNLVSYSWKPID